MKKVCLPALLLGLAVLTVMPALAGFVQQDRDGSMILVAEGKIKAIPAEKQAPWFVADLGTDRVTMGDPVTRRFAAGSTAEFCQVMRQMFAAMAAFSGDPETQGGEAGKVQVTRKGAGGEIAGFSTVKYAVHIDGQLVEEVWLTDDADLLAELEGLKNTDFMACTADHPALAASAAYAELQKKGWALKVVAHEDGEAYVDMEVVLLEKKTIPAAAFQAPADYDRVTFGKLFEMYR